MNYEHTHSSKMPLPPTISFEVWLEAIDAGTMPWHAPLTHGGAFVYKKKLTSYGVKCAEL